MAKKRATNPEPLPIPQSLVEKANRAEHAYEKRQAAHSKPKAKDVLRELADTIEAAGGVIRDPNGIYHPAGDEEWSDLGDVYIKACQVLGKEPIVTDRQPGPPWVCDDCGAVNDEQDMEAETDVLGLICPDCGSGHVRLVEECGNCDEPIPADRKDGFCSDHCRNRHRGERCPGECSYCEDDELD